MKQILIEVSATGEVKIEAAGFKGQACEKATEAIEKALGVAGKRTRKPDYCQGNTQTQKVGQ
jgi:hypothetical protein